MATTERTGRAVAMPPDQRRAAIVRATIPLVQEHGFDVSTKQIAAAAGIAEGTIFRVFETKDELLHEAIRAAVDRSEVERKLNAIDSTLPLEQRVEAAALIIQERMRDTVRLIAAVGWSHIPPEGEPERRARHEQFIDLLAELFRPDRDHLACDPADAARYFHVLAHGGSHPHLAGGRILAPAEIASVLLNGITRQERRS